jgi:hypothetical protein
MIEYARGVRNAWAIVAVVAVTSAGAGCDNPFGSCTLIGCSSGIRLTFDSTPPAGTIVELEATSGFPWRVECGVDWNCEFDLRFDDFMPDHVTVRVVTPTGEVSQFLSPDYRDHQPNGRGCGPTCRIATIELALPV